MNIRDIINKKRLKEELTKEEIFYAVNSYISGDTKDYQMSALLMAITINGMTKEEILNLTDVMLKSGEILNFDDIDGVVVDKHSTGGVGDKVTIILAPLLASLGINIAKMSGRGLGYTGGTIDKLESIPGFNVNLNTEQFLKQVKDIKIAVSGASANLDIADKKIYALRDVTSTVESIPLIASSIMSKKLASNADVIVIDVKVGTGALMKTKKEAIKLARELIEIGKNYNKKVFCILTNMNQPLGYTVGNKLEIIESIDALKGNGAKDLMEVVYSIASIIVSEVESISLEEAFVKIAKNIENGEAYNKFEEFVKYQNGNIDDIKDDAKKVTIKSDKSGYINSIDAMKIAKLSFKLGAGRENKEDNIDYDVGIKLLKKVGEYVEVGEDLGEVYYNSNKIENSEFLDCFKIEDNKDCEDKVIYGMICQKM